MDINIFKQSDLQRVKHLQPEGWSDITTEFEFYINSDFCTPIKIELDDKIVGVGASIAFEKTAWLAHIIVDSNYRNRGIGYEIVNELIYRLKRDFSTETFLLIATELGRPLYLKFGFRDVSNYLFMNREQPWKGQPISSKIAGFQEEFRSSVYDIVFQATGEQRAKLIDPFIKSSKVYIENGKVTGYYLPGLREGLIYTQTSEAGLELMRYKYSKVDKAVLPSENKVGVDFLKTNGFAEISTKGTKMIMGNELEWKPNMMYSRISGNFG
jgi:GNAT superfamily N-acetyltransferase